MGEQENKFEYLVEGLLTERGRDIAIERAVKGGLTQKPEYIERAIQLREIKGEYVEALRLALKRGDGVRANRLYDIGIRIYEKLGSFGECAKLAEEMGDGVKAEMYKNLALLLENKM